MFKRILAAFALTMPAVASAQPAPPAKRTVMLPAGAPVPLALAHGVSAKTARVGDRVVLRTIQAIVHNGKVVIPAGTSVMGAVARVDEARGGRPGGIVIEADAIVLEQGGRIALDGTLARQGQDYRRTLGGAAGAPMVGGSLVVPLGRRNVSPNLEAGTAFLARTARDF